VLGEFFPKTVVLTYLCIFLFAKTFQQIHGTRSSLCHLYSAVLIYQYMYWVQVLYLKVENHSFSLSVCEEYLGNFGTSVAEPESEPVEPTYFQSRISFS
jgi:hypothetical protein